MWGPVDRAAHCYVLKKILTQERFMAAAHCRGTLKNFFLLGRLQSSENSRKKMKRKSFESQAQTLKIGVSKCRNTISILGG